VIFVFRRLLSIWLPLLLLPCLRLTSTTQDKQNGNTETWNTYISKITTIFAKILTEIASCQLRQTGQNCVQAIKVKLMWNRFGDICSRDNCA